MQQLASPSPFGHELLTPGALIAVRTLTRRAVLGELFATSAIDDGADCFCQWASIWRVEFGDVAQDQGFFAKLRTRAIQYSQLNI